jgi:Leucine-rich repeat (LRR) protein
MKSKLNSNIGVNHPHKVSCLISERKIKKDIFSISYNYKKNAKRLNLPNCQINDLSGIEQFKDLTYLNLNNNQIADFDTFTKLNVCTKLR